MTEVAAHAEALVRQVQSTGSRTAVQVGDETVAALVPPESLEILEPLEDRPDLLDALDTLADPQASGGVPLEDLNRHLES